MRIAILDFGTNTFNLLITEIADDKSFIILHDAKEPVKLGQGGILQKTITPEAFERGLKAIKSHFENIEKFKVDKTYAFATSAIREAKNGKDFIWEVKKQFNLYVNIIPGEREAELIYKGVRKSYNIGNEKVLIIDIGGGSNELIIADGQKIYWKESFKLGMARMLDQFQPKDPVSSDEIKKIESFFEAQLSTLYNAVNEYNPIKLIGSSGSFETFFALLAHRIPEKYKLNSEYSRKILIEDYFNLHKILLNSTIEDRKNMKGMELYRVEMIVIASIFVNFVLKKCNIEEIIQSDFALKEGVIAEVFDV